MPSEQQIQYHRTFLSLDICRTIYNEDERYQHNPSGPPNRQSKESDPVFKYHVHSCPRYPQRAPGLPTDPQYNAFLARSEEVLEPLVIIPKRGQNFGTVAQPWEITNSVLCGGWGRFSPIVNSRMEVTAHYANIDESELIHPKGINFKEISDYLVRDENSIRLYFGSAMSIPQGWDIFYEYNGGISVVVLPNGKVVRAQGHLFSGKNGQAISTWSPLDFWSPGQRWAAGAIRAITNRVGTTARAGWRLLTAPTKEAAESAAARLGTTLAAKAASTAGGGVLPVAHLGRRTLIMGEDMAHFRSLLARSHSESGLYDVIIHSETDSFSILVKTKPDGTEIWREVSAREVADAVRPQLAPGDKIRLLSCQAGLKGPQRVGPGPAQRLANELDREVWASEETLSAVPKTFSNGSKVFVPDFGGKFRHFAPQHRGDGTLVGPGGGKVTGNVLHGEVRPGSRK